MARSPRGARARSRVKVVGVAVSSTKTKRCGVELRRSPSRHALPRRLVPLGGDQRLFLSGSPSRVRARDMVAALTATPWAAPSAHSARPAWRRDAPRTCARSAASACSADVAPPSLVAASAPRCRVSRRRCCQRRIVRSVTPKVRAASARASPASRARSKRSRKSAGYLFHPPSIAPGHSGATRSRRHLWQVPAAAGRPGISSPRIVRQKPASTRGQVGETGACEPSWLLRREHRRVGCRFGCALAAARFASGGPPCLDCRDSYPGCACRARHRPAAHGRLAFRRDEHHHASAATRR